MTQAPIRTLILDWNGTLFDDFDAVLDCFNVLFKHYGHPPSSAERFRRNYAFPFTALMQNHGFSVEEIAPIAEEAKNIFHAHYGPREALLGLREGAVDLLRQVQQSGIRCVILSNHMVGKIASHAERLGIAPYFDEIIAYADQASQGHHLTKGDMLKAYLEKEQGPAESMLIVGDSVEEIHIGRQQGLRTAGITGGATSEERLRAEHPDYLIHSLYELLPILTEKVAA